MILPVPIAIALAVCLFVALSGDVRIVRRIPPPCRRGLVVKSGWLAGRAAAEEMMWRWLVLGQLRLALGMPAAFALSVGGFALAHRASQGSRGMVVHLVTGSAFSALYVATGSLVAPVVAHAVYNILVAVAVEAEGQEIAGRVSAG